MLQRVPLSLLPVFALKLLLYVYECDKVTLDAKIVNRDHGRHCFGFVVLYFKAPSKRGFGLGVKKIWSIISIQKNPSRFSRGPWSFSCHLFFHNHPFLKTATTMHWFIFNTCQFQIKFFRCFISFIGLLRKVMKNVTGFCSCNWGQSWLFIVIWIFKVMFIHLIFFLLTLGHY